MMPTPSVSVSVGVDWRVGGKRIIDKLPPRDKYRTCCNCCHIITGTLFLGLVELVAVAFLLVSIVQQLQWKHDGDRAPCLAAKASAKELLRDCLIFDFPHFNVTLVGDYVIALLMISILLSIVFMFFGIITKSPGYLIPHIIVQAFGLIFSLGYFFLYAWSYFHGDLYIHKRHFELEAFYERMWLASILLVFAAFQCYLFVTVVKCCLFLQTLNKAELQRKSQFEEVSNRVRLAKENGLWRNTSWGGGFQQYIGQYENEENKAKEKEQRKKDRPAARVQWALQKNEEKSISLCPSTSTPEPDAAPRKPLPVVALDKEPKKPALKGSSRSPSRPQHKSSPPGSSESSRNRTSPSGKTATADSRSPTRLHKTDSGGTSRPHRVSISMTSPGQETTRDSSSSSPLMRKKRIGAGGSPTRTVIVMQSEPSDSPKASHKSKRGREDSYPFASHTTSAAAYAYDHRPSRDYITTAGPSPPRDRSPGKPATFAATTPVKKVSITSTSPPTFHAVY